MRTGPRRFRVWPDDVVLAHGKHPLEVIRHARNALEILEEERRVHAAVAQDRLRTALVDEDKVVEVVHPVVQNLWRREGGAKARETGIRMERAPRGTPI